MKPILLLLLVATFSLETVYGASSGREIRISPIDDGVDYVYSEAVPLSDNRVVIAANNTSFAQLVDVNGNEISVVQDLSSNTGDEFITSSGNNNNFVIAWARGLMSGARQVYIKMYSNTGSELGEEVILSDSSDWPDSLTLLDNGNIVIAWMKQHPGYGLRNYYKLKIIDASGNIVNDEILFESEQSSNIAREWDSSVKRLNNGGFAVFWAEKRNVQVDPNIYEGDATCNTSEGVTECFAGVSIVHGQIFTETGEPAGDKFSISQTDGLIRDLGGMLAVDVVDEDNAHFSYV